jgi:hypothetical protein
MFRFKNKRPSYSLLTYLLIYLLTYLLHEDDGRFSVSLEIPRILWNPKANYAFTRLSLSWARSMQSMPPTHPTSEHPS